MLRTLVATEIELQRAASKPSSSRCSAEGSQQVPVSSQNESFAGPMEHAPCTLTTRHGARSCRWCTWTVEVPANLPGRRSSDVF